MSANDPSGFETTIAPWLAVHDARAAVSFYSAAFEAAERYPLEGHDGTLEVSRLAIGRATLWVQRDLGTALGTHERHRVRLILSVADPDATFANATAAGATAVRAVSAAHGWRTGRVTDPFGHDWEISRQLDG